MNHILKNLLIVSIICFAGKVYSQADSAQTDLSFDFGITRGRNINVWPILKKFKNQEKSELQILYPLFSKTINYSIPSKHFHFLPFIINDSGPQGIDRRYFSFFYPSVFHVERQNLLNTQINSFNFLELAPGISCLGISRSPEGLFVDNNLFFFLWYKRDMLLNKTRLIVFPSYWYFSDNDKSTRLFLPFYFARRTPERKFVNIALLYNFDKTKCSKRNVLFPIYWNTVNYLENDTTKNNLLFPVYRSSKSKLNNNKILFPLLYSLQSPDYKLFTLLPLISTGHSPDFTKRHLDLCLIYWHNTSKFGTNNIVFPLWWGSKKYSPNDTIRRNILFPIYWSHKSATKQSDIFFPMVYKLKKPGWESLTIAPFFSKGKDTFTGNKYLAISPLYWHLNNGNSTKDIFLPLFWRNKQYFDNDTVTKNTLFPIFWSVNSNEKNHKILFPIVYKIQNLEIQSFTLLPFFSFGENLHSGNRYLALTPLYWHINQTHKKKDIVFPVFWSKRQYFDNDTVTKNTLFPVFWSVKSNSKNYKILFPFIYNIKNDYRHSLTVFPVFSYGMRTYSGNWHLSVTPFYWHLDQGNKKRDILFPIFWSKRQYFENETIKKNVLFPFYWASKTMDKNNKVLFPFIFSLQDYKYQSFTFFPFFSVGHSPEYTTRHIEIFPVYTHIKTKESLNKIIFPLWLSREKYFANDTLYRKILFPVYWWARNNQKENKIFFPLAFQFKNQNRQSLTLLPFFSFGHDNYLNHKYFAITPFYWHLDKVNKKKDIIFPVFWKSRQYFDNDTVTRNTLFPVYWSVKNKTKDYDICFPIFYKIKNQYKQSFTLIPLFSYGKSSLTGNRHIAVTPFYWHFEQKNKKTNLVFPIFWESTQLLDNEHIKKTMLFPVYWSVQSNYRNNKVLFPVMYKLQNKDYQSSTFIPFFSTGHSPDYSVSHFQFLPIYWRFKSKESMNTFLFPLWWNNQKYLQNDTLCRKILFPVYWSAKSKDKDNRILFPLVYQVHNQSGQSLTFLPFFSVGKKTITGNKYLAITPLYLHFSSENKKQDILFPFFWSKKQYKGIDTIKRNSIFPLYYSVAANETKNKVLLPFVFSFQNTKYQSFTLFPLFSSGHSTAFDRKHLMITPFAGFFSNDKQSRMFIFPLFNYKKSQTETKSSVLYFLFRKTSGPDYSKTSLLWPICEHSKSSGRASLRVAPLIWYNKTDTSKMSSFQPLYYSYTSNYKRTLSVFWFLYKHENLKNYCVSNSLLWKLFNTERYTNNCLSPISKLVDNFILSQRSCC
jgi:hypothetical protein